MKKRQKKKQKQKKIQKQKQKQVNLLQLKCPCCGDFITKKRIKKTLSLLPFDGLLIRQSSEYINDGFIKGLADFSFYQWACDNCLSEEKAILGNPTKQNYSAWGIPYLAYFDKGFTCKKCQDKFTFSSSEQQFWYEKLTFSVYAKPNNCLPCRKEIKVKKNLNIRLSELLKDGDPQNATELEEIAAIYKLMEKKERYKEYTTKSKKFR